MTGKERNILDRIEEKVDLLMQNMATSSERAVGCERRFKALEEGVKEQKAEAKAGAKDTRKVENRMYALMGGVGLLGALAGPFLAALFRKLLQVL